ncbi:MAG: helix-turn-helix domain-containing protein [Pseudomonadota bacterium]
MLSTARDLIGEHGYHGVTMRALADRSGVAYKTLYDLYGSKDQLLVRAVEDQLANVSERIVAAVSSTGFERLMDLIEQSGAAVLDVSSLSKALQPIFSADPGRFSLKGLFDINYRKAMDEIADAGDMVDWADLDFLVNQLLLESTSVRLYWTNGLIPDSNFSAMQQFAACRVLMPVTIGHTKSRVEARYRTLHTRLRATLSDG